MAGPAVLGMAASVALGACGGATVSAIAFSNDLFAWREARRAAARHHPRPSKMAPLTHYVDLKADFLVLLTRLVLGAFAGWLFRSELTGVYAAIAVGAAAPGLLTQLDRGRSKEADPEPLSPVIEEG
jgi:hypothetical protein